MREDSPTRRAVLGLLVAAPWAVSSLAACEKKRTEPESCQDVSALSGGEQMGRALQQYTDRAPSADKQCDKCDFWKAPSDPAQCGGCRVVSGPIHPKGYCAMFAAKS